jgi:thioredoxin-dependent peroxiredoxin
VVDNHIPQVGEAAPAFSATASTGPVSLEDFKGKQSVVLYFYPKADTTGCTKEACAFRDASADLRKRGIAVIGVSADDVAAQQAFDEKYKLRFPLISDTDHHVLDAYGVWGERVRADGSTFMGIRRWTFLIDKAGTVRKVYQNVTPEEHAGEILRDADSLGLA